MCLALHISATISTTPAAVLSQVFLVKPWALILVHVFPNAWMGRLRVPQCGCLTLNWIVCGAVTEVSRGWLWLYLDANTGSVSALTEKGRLGLQHHMSLSSPVPLDNLVRHCVPRLKATGRTYHCANRLQCNHSPDKCEQWIESLCSRTGQDVCYTALFIGRLCAHCSMASIDCQGQK